MNKKLLVWDKWQAKKAYGLLCVYTYLCMHTYFKTVHSWISIGIGAGIDMYAYCLKILFI